MQTSDASRFRDFLRGMGRMYGSDLDSLVLDVYWLALDDWDFEEFKQAAIYLMKHSKFMPRPAEFLELRKAGEPTKFEAWEIALVACKGWRNSRCSAGEKIDRVISAVGGYEALAMAETTYALPNIQRRFLEAYDDMSNRATIREEVPAITDSVRNLAVTDRAARKRLANTDVAASEQYGGDAGGKTK